MMRVALLTREFPPEVYGGAGVHVEYLAAELARLMAVSVHCFGAPRASELVAGAYQPWPALERGPAAAALQAVSIDLLMAQGAQGCDVVHSHTWYANLGGHLAKLMYGIPHVVTAHSLEPLRPWKAEQLGSGGYAISLFCERTAFEAADAVVAVSAGMRNDVMTTYPAIDPDRVAVIYNGVDPNQYRPDPNTDLIEPLGIDPLRPSVVYIGRITRQKGILELLDAAGDLDPSAQLVLCASAPDTAEIASQFTEAVARLQQQRADVFWINQMLPRPVVVQILSHASVFVCPSLYEPFGLVNIEAMACGAAVVAASTGGIPEIVVDGETGYLVAPGPHLANAMAQRINELLADREKARRFGQAGRQPVLERFSWPAIARQTVDLYRRLGPD